MDMAYAEDECPDVEEWKNYVFSRTLGLEILYSEYRYLFKESNICTSTSKYDLIHSASPVPSSCRRV